MKKLAGFAGLVALVFAMMLPASGWAVTQLDFRTGSGTPMGGTITQSGSDYTGSDIPLDSLQVVGAPQNNGAYDLDGHSVSGGYSPFDGLAALFSFNTGTKAFVVDGTIPGMSISTNTNLLTGTISSWSVTPNQFTGALTFNFFGLDTKTPSLVSYLGLPAGQNWSFSGTEITGTAGHGAFSTDIANTAIPEPGTLLLLGFGLVGLVGVRRYKK
jgi:hypothetical protein